MKITSIQALLDQQVVGKVIAEQPNIHENYWHTKILWIRPCDLNYGCDSGFMIGTDAVGGCNAFTIDADQQIAFEE